MTDPVLARPLYVYFSAGCTRYAVEAMGVLEVAQPLGEGELREHLGLRDFSLLLGGEPERRPSPAMVLDTSPTLAVRIRNIDGVFATPAEARLPLPRRMIPLVAPALRGGLLREGSLSFEVDMEGVNRGIPRSTRRPERIVRSSSAPKLFFESAGERLSVDLSSVLQVLSLGPQFNRAPSAGAFLGAAVYRQRLCPVFSIGVLEGPEAFVIVTEVGGELLGLSSSRVFGSSQPEVGQGQAAAVLDLECMFS